jgi:hypothetical protein
MQRGQTERSQEKSPYWGEAIHFIYVTAQKQDGKGEDYGIKDGK